MVSPSSQGRLCCTAGQAASAWQAFPGLHARIGAGLELQPQVGSDCSQEKGSRQMVHEVLPGVQRQQLQGMTNPLGAPNTTWAPGDKQGATIAHAGLETPK